MGLQSFSDRSSQLGGLLSPVAVANFSDEERYLQREKESVLERPKDSHASYGKGQGAIHRVKDLTKSLRISYVMRSERKVRSPLPLSQASCRMNHFNASPVLLDGEYVHGKV